MLFLSSLDELHWMQIHKSLYIFVGLCTPLCWFPKFWCWSWNTRWGWGKLHFSPNRKVVQLNINKIGYLMQLTSHRLGWVEISTCFLPVFNLFSDPFKILYIFIIIFIRYHYLIIIYVWMLILLASKLKYEN